MFYVKIETDNDAFQDGDRRELLQLLQDVRDGLRNGHFSGTLRDSNGNIVGTWANNGKVTLD